MKKISKGLILLFLMCSFICCAIACAKPDGNFPSGSGHVCAFDKQVVESKYLKSDATCMSKALYFYSCSCGEKGTETFESGEIIPHKFTLYTYDYNATHQSDGTKSAICDYLCGTKDTITAEGTKLDGTFIFKTFTQDGLIVTGTVANATTSFSFVDEISASADIEWVVSYDEFGVQTSFTKTIPLTIGDNKVYVITKENGQIEAKYEVTIRRRPMYTVSFEGLDGVQVEEDSTVTAPSATPSKVGYDFNGWDYDFATPITSDITINANWRGKTYNVSFDVNGGQGSIAPIQVVYGEGITLPSATPSLNNNCFDGWYYQNNKISNQSIWNIPSNATLVAKWESCLYYNQDGEITGLCSKLRQESNIVIPTQINGTQIKVIGHSAFSRCTSLESITIPNSVESIGDFAFYDCSSLENITVAEDNEHYKSIDGNLYTKSGGILLKYAPAKTATSFDIPNSVESIENYAFSGCNSLESITIPNSVTSIDSYAFEGCSSLESITVAEDNEHFKSIDGNLYTKDGKILVQYALGKTATSFAIPNSVERIKGGAFYGCSSLESITIPNSVESIGNFAFYGCTSLQSITIPNSVTSIGYSMFEGCTSLESIVIPNSVTSIGSYTFYGCSSLESITIPNSVERIEGCAFWGCTSLEGVTIPNSVTSIGYAAFNRCTSLESITIPNSVTSIGSAAFNSCTSLESITVAEENEYYKSIDGNLYTKDGKTLVQYALGKTATSFAIPNSVERIKDGAFYGCSSLESIVIPNSVSSIDFFAFEGCTSLESITIPNSVESIGNYAFSGCSSLKSITIPNSVSSIGNYAFSGCTSLESITIPNSVTSIGYCMFEGCTSLESINFNGTTEEWETIEKDSYWNSGLIVTEVVCSDGNVAI